VKNGRGGYVAFRSIRTSIQQGSPVFWLFAVSILYLFAQVLLFDESRYLEWDEAEYLARASSQLSTPEWPAHRALGIVWIISPVTMIGGSLVVLRWYLVVVSALAVALAFSRWIRPVGIVAPIGMAIFASGWLALFYGSEISPNLYVAVAAVGAAGSLAAYVIGKRNTDLLWLAAFVGTAFVLRPSDAVVLSAGLAAASVVVLKRADVIRVGSALLAGFLVGVTPWVIESYRHFGGPFARLEAASENVGQGFALKLVEQLRLADGPLVGPDPLGVASPATLVVVGIGGLIAIFGVMTREMRPAVPIAFGVGALLGLPYLVYVDVSAPRFLLPSIALMSIPIGLGLLALRDRRASLGVLAVGFLAVSLVWSVSVATSVHRAQFGFREVIRTTGEAIDQMTDADSCRLMSLVGSPSLAVETGCEVRHLGVDEIPCQVEAMQSEAPESDILIVLSNRLDLKELTFLTPVPESGLPEPLVLFNVRAGSDIGCRSG
jgi:hypothetical protein